MGWEKPPKPNGFGGFKTTRNDRGQNESIHGRTIKQGNVDHANHVHYHKDGVTITKGGRKQYTISQKYCSRCGKKTAHRVTPDASYCTHCEQHLIGFPK